MISGNDRCLLEQNIIKKMTKIRKTRASRSEATTHLHVVVKIEIEEIENFQSNKKQTK